MPDRMVVLDCPIRKQDSVVMHVFRFLKRRLPQKLAHALAVLWVDSRPEYFACGQTLLGIYFKNSEHFLGPVKALFAEGVPGPTAGVT